MLSSPQQEICSFHRDVFFAGLHNKCDLAAGRIQSDISNSVTAIQNSITSSTNEVISNITCTDANFIRHLDSSLDQKLGLISQASNKVADAISSIPNGSYSLGLFNATAGAFIAAVAAFMFNFIYWKISERNKHLIAFSSEVYNVISVLEKVSCNYWLRDHHDKDHIDEFIIRTKVLTVKKSLKYIVNEIKVEQHDQLKKFVRDIFEKTTADDFASVKRKKNKKRATEISHLCTDAKLLLSNPIRKSMKLKEYFI